MPTTELIQVEGVNNKDIQTYANWLNKINAKNPNYSLQIYPSVERYTCFDGIQLKVSNEQPDDIELQFIELKGRNVSISKYPDCAIDVHKIKSLQALAASTDRQVFIVALYYLDNQLAIWQIDPETDYSEYQATIYANTVTATDNPTKAYKEFIKLPLSQATIWSL